MIKTIKKAFGGDPIDGLSKDSQGIVDIFTRTVDDLKELNTQIDIHSVERENAIKKLTLEMEKLSSIKGDNEKVISKIAKIFE